MARTSFSNKPKLLFGDLRVGIAYNQTDGVPDRANFYIQPGIGIELAKGKSFSSYLLLDYTYNSMTFYGDKADTLIHGLNRVTVSIGVMPEDHGIGLRQQKAWMIPRLLSYSV